MIERFLPYIVPFVGALALTLVLTPLVREINRKMGLVDNPDERRINKTPIPRGGGIAVYLGVVISYSVFVFATGLPPLGSVSPSTFWKLIAAAGIITAVGFADDKYSLPPKIKLLCQIAVSFLIWSWAGLGFSDLWPSLNPVVDCVITVLWITGAMNAFNLIDGLDGLASGLAVIAVIGMAGGLFFTGNTAQISFYAAFVGGLLGFLKYNYNPANVFLGDSGSMMIGCLISVLPLCSHVENSFLVSVGVPVLAMGVPIFDTLLAILRRSIRSFLGSSSRGGGDGAVMTADTDHLHHRILRSVGLSQSRAAWALYSVAFLAVLVGLVAAYLRSRTSGLWLAAFSVATAIVFRDMARVEIFDMGVLLNRVARSQDKTKRRLLVRLAVPFTLIVDVAVIVSALVTVSWMMGVAFNDALAHVILPVLVSAIFAGLVVARTYMTVWSRAMPSNYLKLFIGCMAGSIAGSVILYYIDDAFEPFILPLGFFHAVLSFLGLLGVRVARAIARDVFYALDCSRLVGRRDVTRILVYGAGLRYRAFRRELVRSALENTRIIVGIVDDDILLKGRYVGGLRVLGPSRDIPEIVERFNIGSMVVTCDIGDEKLAVLRDIARSSGISLGKFTIGESPVVPSAENKKEQ